MHEFFQTVRFETSDDVDTLQVPLTCRLVHSLSGRLRLRIPILAHSKELTRCAAYRLSRAEGVREISSNYHCGSITIHYDSDTINEQDLLRHVRQTHLSDLLSVKKRFPELMKGVTRKTKRRLRWSVAAVILTMVFSGTFFPVRILIYVMIIFISIPIYRQAYETVFMKRKFDLALLNAFAMTLGLLADDLVVTSIMAMLIYLGDYVNELIATGSSRTLCMLMGDGSDATAQTPANRQRRLITGLGTLALGIILLPLPGPGIVIIPIGLGMLAKERAWAARLDRWFRKRFQAQLPTPNANHAMAAAK